MHIRTANLICAFCAFLITIGAASGARWAGSQPRLHAVTIDDFMNARGLIMVLVVICWFAGAIGLFFRKRLAWIGSLIGVGAAVCCFVAVLVLSIGLYVYPDSEMVRLKNMGGPGYIGAMIVVVIQLSLFLTISLGLFIGLLRKRKELLGR